MNAFPVNLSSFNIISKNQTLKGKYTLWKADKALQKSATEKRKILPLPGIEPQPSSLSLY
jgi:hypothetical protein